MPNWTRLTAPATGAFSKTWLTRIAALLGAAILAAVFLVNSCFSTTRSTPESLIEAEGIAGDRAALQLGQRVDDITTRVALDAAAAARTLDAEGTQLTGGQVTPAFNPTTGETDDTAPVIIPLTDDEAQLREVSGWKPSSGVPGRSAPSRWSSPTVNPAGSRRQRQPPRPSPPRHRRPRPATRPPPP